MIGWLRRIFRSRRVANQEALAASTSAAASLARANRDFIEAERLRTEADVIAERLRAHNAANRYDDWLREVLSR